MVVDDNKYSLKVADRLLRNYNFDVTLASSGKTCIDLIKQNKKYDLILLDQLMPDMSGIEALRTLKEIGQGNLPPIIVTTANLSDDLKDSFIKEGFNGYLSKPINNEKIKGIVGYYFKK